MARARNLLLVLAAWLAACGGGGGGITIQFGISGSSPADGAAEAPVDSAIAITFTLPADLATITAATVRLERIDGTPVATRLLTQDFNGTTIRLEPLVPLLQNAQYRVVISGAVTSASGTPLGTDRQFCFITLSVTPTVRPDQIVDLGDRLNIARFEARFVRTQEGRCFVFGGFVDENNATPTVEEWDPTTRTFRLSGNMLVPRAQHTLTLLNSGNVVIAGGVSTPGGPPLKSTEIFGPAGGSVSPGPDLNDARTWHAASRHFSGASAMVSGGFGAGGVPLDSVEFLDGPVWRRIAPGLPEPTVQHVQADFDFDKVYFGVGNLAGTSGYYDGLSILGKQEGDVRFRSRFTRIGSNRLFIVGGDTRSAVVYDFNANITWFSTDFLRERRGNHSLTPRGLSGSRFLAAGGFNIAAQGSPALRTLEIVDFLDPGPFGFPDAAFYRAEEVQLPVPFAGHIGFVQADGATVLAGGWGGDSGPHSRRVVMILDEATTPPVTCASE